MRADAAWLRDLAVYWSLLLWVVAFCLASWLAVILLAEWAIRAA